MSPLLIVWSLSLLTLVAIGAYALSRVRHEREGGDLSALIAYTALDSYRIARRGTDSALPHVRRVIVFGVRRGKEGYELMLDRMFGKGEVERGRTASFFLKHIAEEKEAKRSERSGGAEGM